MLQETAERRVLGLLADILDYPLSNPAEKVQECVALVSSSHPDAAARLRQFQTFAEETPEGRLEEIYTMTFDLDAACHPYVGYHLFGESYKRSTFLLELKERYRACGFVASETELPDRLSVLLRFLSVSIDEELREEIINEGLLPTLSKMTKAANKDANKADEERQREGDGYRHVLQALSLILARPEPSATAAQGAHGLTGGKDNA